MLSANATSLQTWAEHQLAEESFTWMQDQVLKIQKNPAIHFYTSLSLAARQNVAILKDTPEIELEKEYHWKAKAWNSRTLMRAIFCLTASENLDSSFLNEAFNTADLNESIDLYQILPLFPQTPESIARAKEGLRSNVSSVFNAVAHNNPLPLAFEEQAWNQMILKALFIDSPLSPILELENHWNEQLATMLSDYADERVAANRPVPFELWRCISPFLNERHHLLIKEKWSSENPKEIAALILCLKNSELEWAQNLLKTKNCPETYNSWEKICPT